MMMNSIQVGQVKRSATVDEILPAVSRMGRCSVCGKRAELVNSRWVPSQTCPHCNYVLNS